MLVCYSLAKHEPSTMYLSNYLLQGITWEHRSRGNIGDFLKTTILVLAPLKGNYKVFDKLKGVSSIYLVIACSISIKLCYLKIIFACQCC